MASRSRGYARAVSAPADCSTAGPRLIGRQRRAPLRASLIASCTSDGVRPTARIVPAYGTVMLPLVSTILVRQRHKVTGSRSGIAWDEETTGLGLKDRDAHHVADAERDARRRPGKHVARAGPALSSRSRISRRVMPRAAPLRMRDRRRCEEKNRKGTRDGRDNGGRPGRIGQSSAGQRENRWRASRTTLGQFSRPASHPEGDMSASGNMIIP
jgi:hypothetical protein